MKHDDVVKNGKWLADKLVADIKEKFNQAVKVSYGIVLKDGEADFAIGLHNLADLGQPVSDKIVDFVKLRVPELIPESKSDVKSHFGVRFQ